MPKTKTTKKKKTYWLRLDATDKPDWVLAGVSAAKVVAVFSKKKDAEGAGYKGRIQAVHIIKARMP